MATNPIDSIQQWMHGVGHGDQQFTLYGALLLEEMGEWFSHCHVVDDEGNRDTAHPHFSEALKELSKILRSHSGSLMINSDDLEKLADDCLDVAWVALGMAATIFGTENLREAWSRLHKANVTDKQVGGVFQLDGSGKVIKPEGWTPPRYNDLIKESQ